jgi:hypothetical protein
MTLILTGQSSATKEGFEIDKLRALVAKHLDVNISLVTIEILLNFADSSQKAHKRFVRLTIGIFTPDAIARLQKP